MAPTTSAFVLQDTIDGLQTQYYDFVGVSCFIASENPENLEYVTVYDKRTSERKRFRVGKFWADAYNRKNSEEKFYYGSEMYNACQCIIDFANNPLLINVKPILT